MDVYATQLIDVGSSAGSRIKIAADSILAPGGPINWHCKSIYPNSSIGISLGRK